VKVAESKYFENFIVILILLATLAMLMEDFSDE